MARETLNCVYYLSLQFQRYTQPLYDRVPVVNLNNFNCMFEIDLIVCNLGHIMLS